MNIEALPGRLKKAKDSASIVCLNYNFQAKLDDDEAVIKSMNEQVMSAIDSLNSDTVFDCTKLEKFCDESPLKTQHERFGYALSALLIHLMSEREQRIAAQMSSSNLVSSTINPIAPDRNLKTEAPRPIIGSTNGTSTGATTIRSQVILPRMEDAPIQGPRIEPPELRMVKFEKQTDAHGNSGEQRGPSEECDSTCATIHDPAETGERAVVRQVSTKPAPVLQESSTLTVSGPSGRFKVDDQLTIADHLRRIASSAVHTQPLSVDETMEDDEIQVISPQSGTPDAAIEETGNNVMWYDRFTSAFDEPAEVTVSTSAGVSARLEVGKIDNSQGVCSLVAGVAVAPRRKRMIPQCPVTLCPYRGPPRAVDAHMQTAHPAEFESSIYKCVHCDLRTCDEALFKCHNNWMRCDGCKTRVSECQMQAHGGSDKVARPCTNKDCTFLADNARDWIDHFTKKCRHCQKLVPCCETLKDHVRSSNHPPIIKSASLQPLTLSSRIAKICKIRTVNSSSLIIAPGRRKVCTSCNFVSDNKKLFQNHSDDKICPFCLEFVPACSSMAQHCAVVNNQSRCVKKCGDEVCDFREFDHEKLRVHEHTHSTTSTPIRDFSINAVCPYCTERIATAIHFNEHMLKNHLMHYMKQPKVLLCKGGEKNCTFTCARVHEMIEHWEKSVDHGVPAFRFHYDFFKSGAKERGNEELINEFKIPFTVEHLYKMSIQELNKLPLTRAQLEVAKKINTREQCKVNASRHRLKNLYPVEGQNPARPITLS